MSSAEETPPVTDYPEAGQRAEATGVTNEIPQQRSGLSISRLRSSRLGRWAAGAATAAMPIGAATLPAPEAEAQEEDRGFVYHNLSLECRNDDEAYIIHEFELTNNGGVDFMLHIPGEEDGLLTASDHGGGLPVEREDEWSRFFTEEETPTVYDKVVMNAETVDMSEFYELENPCESSDGNGDNGQGGAVSPVEGDRWDGSTRTETAIETSRNTYDEAENAVLTTSQDFPDALAGTPLAAASEGPLLLTGSEELHEGVASELERLGVDHVYVLGGDAAVSEHVEHQLDSHGYQVTRLGGDNRFGTASRVAGELQALTEQPEVVDNDPETDTATSDPETDTATSDPETDTAQTPEEVDNEVLLADGGDFADALAGGSLGAQEGSPILLTPSESLHSATEEYLQNEQVDRVTTLGGAAAVSESVEREAAAAAETEDVDRLAGSTRIDTAIEIANEKLNRSGDRVVNAYFASAYDWPDALAGGHATSQEGDVLLLVNGHDAEANHALDSFIAEQRPDVDRDQWETVTLLGGTAAISEDVEVDLIFRVNAHPTSDDSSTTSNDSSVSAITTDVAADDPDETRRSEEVARKDEINLNSRAVVTYDANGKPQVELENAA